MSTKRNLKETLLDGLEQLIRDGSNKSFWFSSRAIADAMMALKFCLPATEYCQLSGNSLKYMLSESESSNNTLNWNEEIWDTSIAAMALTFEPVKYSTEIIKASN